MSFEDSLPQNRAWLKSERRSAIIAAILVLLSLLNAEFQAVDIYQKEALAPDAFQVFDWLALSAWLFCAFSWLRFYLHHRRCIFFLVRHIDLTERYNAATNDTQREALLDQLIANVIS